MSDTVTIPREEYFQLKQEIKTLRNHSIYKRLLEFEKNVSEDKKYTRKDLGF